MKAMVMVTLEDSEGEDMVIVERAQTIVVGPQESQRPMWGEASRVIGSMIDEASGEAQEQIARWSEYRPNGDDDEEDEDAS